MVLVNNPGTWSAIYAPLRHAAWHGWTPTDMVFPFFVFIAGVAIPFALGPRLERSGQTDAVGRVVRRSAIIFGLGLVLQALPFFDWATLRIPGVLQRIALC
jgi:predicted acyltransferase